MVNRLNSNEYIPRLSQLMTSYTILIEGLIPTAFIFYNKHKMLKVIAHSLLMTFILTTYPIATVVGFSWLLIIFAVTVVGAKIASENLFILYFFSSYFPFA